MTNSTIPIWEELPNELWSHIASQTEFLDLINLGVTDKRRWGIFVREVFQRNDPISSGLQKKLIVEHVRNPKAEMFNIANYVLVHDLRRRLNWIDGRDVALDITVLAKQLNLNVELNETEFHCFVFSETNRTMQLISHAIIPFLTTPQADHLCCNIYLDSLKLHKNNSLELFISHLSDAQFKKIITALLSKPPYKPPTLFLQAAVNRLTDEHHALIASLPKNLGDYVWMKDKVSEMRMVFKILICLSVKLKSDYLSTCFTLINTKLLDTKFRTFCHDMIAALKELYLGAEQNHKSNLVEEVKKNLKNMQANSKNALKCEMLHAFLPFFRATDKLEWVGFIFKQYEAMVHDKIKSLDCSESYFVYDSAKSEALLDMIIEVVPHTSPSRLMAVFELISSSYYYTTAKLSLQNRALSLIVEHLTNNKDKKEYAIKIIASGYFSSEWKVPAHYLTLFTEKEMSDWIASAVCYLTSVSKRLKDIEDNFLYLNNQISDFHQNIKDTIQHKLNLLVLFSDCFQRNASLHEELLSYFEKLIRWREFFVCPALCTVLNLYSHHSSESITRVKGVVQSFIAISIRDSNSLKLLDKFALHFNTGERAVILDRFLSDEGAPNLYEAVIKLKVPLLPVQGSNEMNTFHQAITTKFTSNFGLWTKYLQNLKLFFQIDPELAKQTIIQESVSFTDQNQKDRFNFLCWLVVNRYCETHELTIFQSLFNTESEVEKMILNKLDHTIKEIDEKLKKALFVTNGFGMFPSQINIEGDAKAQNPAFHPR